MGFTEMLAADIRVLQYNSNMLYNNLKVIQSLSNMTYINNELTLKTFTHNISAFSCFHRTNIEHIINLKTNLNLKRNAINFGK